MKWNTRIRRFHRWSSMAFTVTVIAAFATGIQAEPAEWIFYLPLLPLALLLFTGLYLFVLPFTGKRRDGRGAALQT